MDITGKSSVEVQVGPLFCLLETGQMRGLCREGKELVLVKSNRYLSLMDGGENAVLITAICPGYLTVDVDQLSTQLHQSYKHRDAASAITQSNL